MGDITLSRAGKPLPSIDLARRNFLFRFCQGAGATLIPSALWRFRFPELTSLALSDPESSAAETSLFLHPRYRTERPLDATLLKIDPSLDRFIAEQYADQIAAILSIWSRTLAHAPRDFRPIANALAPNFMGASPRQIDSRVVRSSRTLQVRKNKFANEANLSSSAFLEQWQSSLEHFAAIETAEFQITRIEIQPGDSPIIETHIRYEIVGSGQGFHREQRIGEWRMLWQKQPSNRFLLTRWQSLEEMQARSTSPFFVDVTTAALGRNPSYSAQLLRGTDYWRTILDGASGIDIYGHNGVSVADIDKDGFDDLYICQTAGLPNRLYRNRGDGTFDDITDSSGLGLLDNTVCALFADFTNRGHQDVILVRANGPLLFLNEGNGKFREKPDAFHFATPPQGTFTGAALADYDRDGFLDIYFCLYAYYQGTGQYRYPLPYHDANNGPRNFLLRNQRDGSFSDVTAESGLNQNNTRYSFCCGWADFNRDGWPDLYVVNDFGRKNLYRNNGDGTFTDIAAQAGVEDVGAGMSVSVLDYDNDSADDLYIANMWTAAGVRISMLDDFKKDSPASIRALYQKHAMGNSLFDNRGSSFDDATDFSGTGDGRWAWSSDAFDFDHDGFIDLYVTNGMVSGPQRNDLNSFFWRQVVANSPDVPVADRAYEQGWNAVNELIRSDHTWSGFERNVVYVNNHDGTFSDVSAAIGLDFPEDSRSFALADFDHDGRLELFLKNRNAPQLRILENVEANLPPSIVFRLQGTKSNRDAIGTSITIETRAGRQTRTLQAGSGFLSQHSKEIFFGLGDTTGAVRASIHWPSGLVQSLDNLPINHRIWIEEGSAPSRMDPFLKSPALAPNSQPSESLPENVETWLLAPVPAPTFSLPDLSGKIHTLTTEPTLLYFWTTKSPAHRDALNQLEKNFSTWTLGGLRLLALNVDDFVQAPQNATALPGLRYSFPILRTSEDVAAVYNLVYRQLFDRHRDLSLPAAFLVDDQGLIVKVYQGRISPDHVARDLQRIPRTAAERQALALPFATNFTLDVGRNHLSTGALFFQRGYLAQAEASFQQALRDDPSSAEALYGIGSVYLNQNKNADARQIFERCVKLQPNYPDTLPDAWNNLGVLDTREGRISGSIECFQQALKLNPHHLLALDNLGNAYRAGRQWKQAQTAFERALAVDPGDAEANYGLGMVYAQTNDTADAYEYLQRALKARPDYPEALNNLGILYLVTQRRNQAVASFERCIQIAPDFDQSYLNLARIYALEGTRDQARTVLKSLLTRRPDHPQAKQMLQQLDQ